MFPNELARREKNVHKAGLGYAYALQTCLKESMSPYIAILEDDVLLDHEWLERTRLAVQDTENCIGER